MRRTADRPRLAGMTAEDAEVARLLEVWVALRRTALKKRTPEARAAADAAYAAFRDRFAAGVPHPRRADGGGVAAGSAAGADDRPGPHL